MFYIDIYIIFYNIIFNIFLYLREIEFLRYLLKRLFDSLMSTRAFRFIINSKDFSSSSYRDISLSLEDKEP